MPYDDPDCWTAEMDAADAKITVQTIPSKVWVTVYTHEYGEDIAVFATKEMAEKARQTVAYDYWTDAFADHEMPVDPVERADTYFQAMNNRSMNPEYFEIRECTVVSDADTP